MYELELDGQLEDEVADVSGIRTVNVRGITIAGRVRTGVFHFVDVVDDITRDSPDGRGEPIDESKRLAPIPPDIALGVCLVETQVPES